VSFWYLAPKLGETFLGHARTLTPLEYETGGLWRGTCWGHRVYLLSYEDAPVEMDTVPMYLMGDQEKTPKELATVVLQHQDWLQGFAGYFSALQPKMYREMRQMAEKMIGGPRLDWKSIGEITDLGDVLDAIPPAEIIRRLGADKAIEAMGADAAIRTIGADGILAAPEGQKLIEVWKKGLTTEELQQMLREREQK
jgi:hypothetical protein